MDGNLQYNGSWRLLGSCLMHGLLIFSNVTAVVSCFHIRIFGMECNASLLIQFSLICNILFLLKVRVFFLFVYLFSSYIKKTFRSHQLTVTVRISFTLTITWSNSNQLRCYFSWFMLDVKVSFPPVIYQYVKVYIVYHWWITHSFQQDWPLQIKWPKRFYRRQEISQIETFCFS